MSRHQGQIAGLGNQTIAARIRSGVIGKLYTRAPTASKMALASAAPTVVMAGSPQPWGANSGLSISTISMGGDIG